MAVALTADAHAAITAYLDGLEAAGRSPFTVSTYRNTLIGFASRFGLHVTDLEVRQYLETHPSVNTRAVLRAHISCHRLRHSFITRSGRWVAPVGPPEAGGAPENPASTARYYRPTREGLLAVLKKFSTNGYRADN